MSLAQIKQITGHKSDTGVTSIILMNIMSNAKKLLTEFADHSDYEDEQEEEDEDENDLLIQLLSSYTNNNNDV